MSLCLRNAEEKARHSWSAFRRRDTSRTIDAPLVGGSALFGIGWGLAGVCPGPAIAALALAGPEIAGFAAFGLAMLAGMGLSVAVKQWTQPAASAIATKP